MQAYQNAGCKHISCAVASTLTVAEPDRAKGGGAHLYKSQRCDHESVVDCLGLIHLIVTGGGVYLQLYAAVPAGKRAIQDQVLGLHGLVTAALVPEPAQPPAASRVQLADLRGVCRGSQGA